MTRVCHRYARHANLTDVLLPHRDATSVICSDREQRLDELIAHIGVVGPTRFASAVVRNRGRTSTRNHADWAAARLAPPRGVAAGHRWEAPT